MVGTFTRHESTCQIETEAVAFVAVGAKEGDLTAGGIAPENSSLFSSGRDIGEVDRTVRSRRWPFRKIDVIGEKLEAPLRSDTRRLSSECEICKQESPYVTELPAERKSLALIFDFLSNSRSVT
jgi:hypothetical protein